MASMEAEEKIKFLLCVLKNTEGLPNLQAVAVDRGDKQDNIRYQFKAMVKASGQYVVERNRVVAVDEALAPATPTGTAKKTTKAKRVDKASTLDAKKAGEPATPKADGFVDLKYEEPVTPKFIVPDDANGNKDEEAGSTTTTPKTPNFTVPKKRGRPKKDYTADGEDAARPAKKPRKTKKQNDAEERAAKEAERAAASDEQGEATGGEFETKEEDDAA